MLDLSIVSGFIRGEVVDSLPNLLKGSYSRLFHYRPIAGIEDKLYFEEFYKSLKFKKFKTVKNLAHIWYNQLKKTMKLHSLLELILHKEYDNFKVSFISWLRRLEYR